MGEQEKFDGAESDFGQEAGQYEANATDEFKEPNEALSIKTPSLRDSPAHTLSFTSFATEIKKEERSTIINFLNHLIFGMVSALMMIVFGVAIIKVVIEALGIKGQRNPSQ